MHPKYKKIYCCTPVAFHANDEFWIRDTGLISNTLRNMGIESKCIVPLPYYEDDIQKENLIRTQYKNLESTKWWKELHPDAVILYSWGAPKYNKIARAIHKAGIRLHIHLDTAGRFSDYKGKKIQSIKQIINFINYRIVDFFRARHLKYANIITTSQPAASHICSNPFYKNLRHRIINFPAPVATHFRYNPSIQKERRVVCVGRWSDDESDKVKRPEFMLQTAKEVVMADELAQVDIYGKIGTTTQKIYDSFPERLKARIHLKGFVNNSELPAIYNNAQVAICTSYSESTHIASAEAICCGCSLVIPPRKSLHVLQWYTSHNSGSIAAEDTPDSMARSIIHELNLWATQQRTPHEISNYWQSFFHVDKALHRIFEH